MQMPGQTKGRAPLHFAAIRGHAELAGIFLDITLVTTRTRHRYTTRRSADIPTSCGYKAGLRCGCGTRRMTSTPRCIWHASYRSMLKAAQLLVDRGANIHAQHELGGTPFKVLSERAIRRSYGCCRIMCRASQKKKKVAVFTALLYLYLKRSRMLFTRGFFFLVSCLEKLPIRQRRCKFRLELVVR